MNRVSRALRRHGWASLWLASVLLIAGCPAKRPGTTAVFKNRPKRPTSKPTGGAPFAPFANRNKGAAPTEKDAERPLALAGHNSVKSMLAEASRLPEGDRSTYIEAYRMTFSVDKTKRDGRTAMQHYQSLLEKHPNFAPAWRGIGYLYVDNGMQFQPAVESYKRAVAVDDSYGLAHYGLAFLLGAMRKTDEGYQHFLKAMATGLEDERSLKSKFYKDMNEGIRTH